MIIDDIMHEAIDLGACEKSGTVSNYKTLAWLFFTPQGMEFCEKNNFPSIESFRELKDEMSDHSVFVDAGVIQRNNDSAIACVGDTDARLVFDDPTKTHKVIVMHGARVFIVARNYAVVKLVSIGENKISISKDSSSVILR